MKKLSRNEWIAVIVVLAFIFVGQRLFQGVVSPQEQAGRYNAPANVGASLNTNGNGSAAVDATTSQNEALPLPTGTSGDETE